MKYIQNKTQENSKEQINIDKRDKKKVQQMTKDVLVTSRTTNKKARDHLPSR